MAVYTDKTHLIADSMVELHDFAAKIGLALTQFQPGHNRYGLGTKTDDAIEAGAQVISSREIGTINQRWQERRRMIYGERKRRSVAI